MKTKIKAKPSLCKSHVTALEKVRNQLSYKQTMGYKSLILSEENSGKLLRAKLLINEAMKELNDIN